METTNLVQTLEHTAARLLMAAEEDTNNRDDMRLIAAQLQMMTANLDTPDAR